MMNRIDKLFKEKKNNILNIYCTAGYPRLDDTRTVMKALQDNGADMIELGIPFSDPLADGPVIQQSSKQALDNGMTLKKLFEQLAGFRIEIHLPVILMGYLNPVMQFGVENFLQKCSEVGVDGVILPDLPAIEFEEQYQALFKKYGLHMIFLITPETSPDRIRKIDTLSNGFLYMVSASSTTGKNKDLSSQNGYFQRVQMMGLRNPTLVGFGIHDHTSFMNACQYSQGAIIGSAYIRALNEGKDVANATKSFLNKILNKR